MSQLSERTLHTRGRRLRYLIGGSGPPLLLCHGFMGSAENFAQWFPALSPRHTLVIPDLPGCGRSDPLLRPHTAANLADALLPLLDALDVARFDLGGLCLGVPVAMAVVRRRPGDVGRLVLHTPLLSPSLVRRSFHLQAAVFTAPFIYPAAVWCKNRRWVSDLYKRYVVEGGGVDPVAAEVNFRNQRAADRRCTREWLRDGLRRDDTGLLASRDPGALLIADGADRIVDVDRLSALVADCPALRLFLDEGAGHSWTEAAVDRQLAAISAYLDGALHRTAGSPAA